jgi:transcriptional regulator with XRE-family HTH domain
MSQRELDQAAGAKLKELRQLAGKSQEGVCLAADVDQSTLSKVERLGPVAIGWGRFCRLAESLGFNVEVVFRPVGSAAKSSADSADAHRQGSFRK